jgi:hypothetical protein
MWRLVGAGLAIAASVMLVLALPAGASLDRTAAGGPVRVFATAGNGAAGSIVVVGAVGDYGKTLTITQSGKPDPHGNFVKLTLQKGTLEVNSTMFNKQTANAPPTVLDKTTCSFAFIATGQVTLFNGTGAYKGITGSITITTNFGGVAPRYTSGAKKGQCHFGNNVKPLASEGWILGHGTVKLG